MKKTLLIILIALIICIPTIIAIVNFNNVRNQEEKDPNIIKVVVKDFNGEIFEYTEDNTELNTITNLYKNMISNSTPVNAPDGLSQMPFYDVELFKKTTSTKYKFYFSQDISSNYYSTENGKTYLVDSESIQTFLGTKYAANIYTSIALPSLLLSDEYILKPNSASWYSRNYAGEFISVNTQSSIDVSISTISLDNGFSLSFDITPDSTIVKISSKESNVVYFNNTIDKLNISSLPVNEILLIEITSTWNRTEENNYHGEISYCFYTSLKSQTTFKIIKLSDTIVQGDLIGISAINISDTSSISFKSSPDIGYSPVFFKNGDNAYAFIPLSLDLEAGNYTFTLSYGDISQNINLLITNKEFGKSTAIYTLEMYNTYYTEDCLSAVREELEPYLLSSSKVQYWDGVFNEGIITDDIDNILVRGFGRYINIAINDFDGLTGESYRHEGVDYYTRTAGQNVTAVNNGEVIYAGNIDYWGYIVIIEHGYGLKSWYCNLGTITVKVGDKVTKETVVGTTGYTGLCVDSGVHIGLSVFDKYVCPYDIQKYGFNFAK